MIPTKQEMESALKMRQGAELQGKFAVATVAICGLGGLGSHIAGALARAGVGKLILADFDRVEVSNLHRQQYKVGQVGWKKTDALAENLREIAPYLRVETHPVRIDRVNAVELLQGAEVICEAFDNAEEKAMLAEAVLEKLPEKYFVAASGMAGMDSANAIHTRKITEKFYLCGDEASEAGEESLVSSRVMLCAAHQAHMVLRILAGKREP